MVFNVSEYCHINATGCDSSDSDTSSLWYVGVIISICGSIASNFGVNTQKFSMIRELRKGTNRSYALQPVWIMGMLLVVVGAIADFLALGFAAQSLIVPVGGFTMVANLFFASMWLGEIITKMDYFATSLIIVGIVFIAAFADKSNQCYTLDMLICLYGRPIFIIYAVLAGVLIVTVYGSILWLRRLERKEDPRFDKYKAVYPILCGSMSGLLGAQSVLFAKSTIEILASTFNGQNQFIYFGTYVIIICMGLSIFGQVHWLAVGLRYFDAVIMVPVFQCVFILFTIIGGGAYFGEFNDFSVLQTVMFVLGLIVLIIGVIGLAFHKSKTASELLQEKEDETTLAASIENNDMEPHTPLSPTVRFPAHRREISLEIGDLDTRQRSHSATDPSPMPQYHALSPSRFSATLENYDSFDRFNTYGNVWQPALLFYNELPDFDMSRAFSTFRGRHTTGVEGTSGERLEPIQSEMVRSPSRRLSTKTDRSRSSFGVVDSQLSYAMSRSAEDFERSRREKSSNNESTLTTLNELDRV